MIVFVNGEFVPEEQALVSVFDRGFLYGDGLFETIRIHNGRLFLWDEHIKRFEKGAALLRMRCPSSAAQLEASAARLLGMNHLSDGVLRLALSRGSGPRGYSIEGTNAPTVVMTLHALQGTEAEAMPRWRLVTSTLRLPADGDLASSKTCNKLRQILARAEAEAAGADEALLLNADGQAIEAASANLFWVNGTAVSTPPASAGALPGVTRGLVLRLCQDLGIQAWEETPDVDRLHKADGVFLTLSSLGIVEAVSLDGRSLGSSALVGKLHAAYLRTLDAACPPPLT